MHPEDFAHKLAELYPQVYQRLHTRRPKDEYRPSAETLAVLQHLTLAGPLTVTEAAAHFDRAQSAMSELIDRLQAQELVDRVRDSRDKRRILVWLTDKGREVLAKSNEVLDKHLLSLCAANLSEEHKQNLIESLQALIQAFDLLVVNHLRRPP